MTRTLAAILVAIGTGAAHAACPVAADLENGVKIVDRNDGVGIYQRLSNGLIYEAYDIDTPDGYWVESALGVYLTRDGNLKNGDKVPASESTFTFPVPVDQLPAPTDGMKWEGDVKVSKAGQPDEVERKFVSAGPETTLSMGACTYKARVVTIITDFADGTNLVGQMHYLPELGFSFYSAYGTREDWLTDYYVPRSIEVWTQ